MRALLAALLLVPALAFAQASKSSERKQEIVFTESGVIDGKRTAPEMELIDSRPPESFSNLIKIRQNFNDKIRTEQIQ